MPDNRHIVDVTYMQLHVVALLWYDICIVLQIDQCRYFITVLEQYSDVIRLKWKKTDTLLMRYIQAPFKVFFYRSYRYKFHKHFFIYCFHIYNNHIAHIILI